MAKYYQHLIMIIVSYRLFPSPRTKGMIQRIIIDIVCIITILVENVFWSAGFFFFLAARKVQHTSKEQVCTKCCQKPDYLNSLVTLKGGAGSIRRDAVNHTNEDNSIPKQYQMGIKACIVLHSVLHTKCNGSSCVKNKKESLRKRS